MAVKKMTITLEDNLIREIDDFSKELGFKKSELIANAVEFYLDYIDIELAVKRAEEYERGNSKGYSIEEAKKMLNIT
jgi:metal-responsive CopG/Arc/MetJ family transcriptional regulator